MAEKVWEPIWLAIWEQHELQRCWQSHLVSDGSYESGHLTKNVHWGTMKCWGLLKFCGPRSHTSSCLNFKLHLLELWQRDLLYFFFFVLVFPVACYSLNFFGWRLQQSWIISLSSRGVRSPETDNHTLLMFLSLITELSLTLTSPRIQQQSTCCDKYMSPLLKHIWWMNHLKVY